MTHTPGPWAVFRTDEMERIGPPRLHRMWIAPAKWMNDWICAWTERRSGAHRGEKARGCGFEPLDIANARLIAAAPELLEALTGLMWRFDADDTDVNAPAETSPDILAARAAIAKAKDGEAA